jgi:hypothetical protein
LFYRALAKPGPAFLSERGFALGQAALGPNVLESAQAAVRSPDGVTSIEMPAHLHPQPGAGSPSRLLGQLQGVSFEGHRVVPVHDALFLEAEELVQVDPSQRDEGGGEVSRSAREALVEGWDEAGPQVGVGRSDVADPGYPEFVDQPALEESG